MTTEEVLKEYICSRYKSVRQFCQEFDLKYSTVVAMLNRGLRNSNIDTVFPVCKALDISVEPLVKDAAIVELGNEKRKTLGRRIEAYTLFSRMMLETNSYTIDGIPLTKNEKEILFYGVESLVETIRKIRKASEKETKE